MIGHLAEQDNDADLSDQDLSPETACVVARCGHPMPQTDDLHVMPTEIARYDLQSGVLGFLPIGLPIPMDHFGIVTHRHRPPSPGAGLLLQRLTALAQTSGATPA